MPATKTSFGEVAETWFATKRLRPKTRKAYRDALDLVLLPRLGERKVASIDVEVIAKLIRDLEARGLNAIDPKRPLRPLGRSSIENYLLPLQGALQLAVRRRLIAVDPFSLLGKDERPQRAEKVRPHNWTEQEIDELLAAAERIARQPESRQSYVLLLKLTARLGLRLGEVTGLQWQDFDREAGYLHLRRQWCRHGEYGPTKTPAGVRDIPLPDDLRDELIAHRLASPHSQDSDPILCSRTGSPLGHRNVTRRGWEAARDLAELPKSLTFHQLRHAAASRLIAAGLDVVTVAAILGHDDPTVTLKTYAHLFDRQNKHDAVRVALAGGAQA
jgi:integrase